MPHSKFSLALSAAVMLVAASGCASDSSVAQGTGTLQVLLTDAPFPTDSVSRVDVFVVRVDGKIAESDSAEAARGVSDDSAETGGWVTLATPKQKIELLALQNGLTTTLGSSQVAAGSYRSFRLIIDPAQSSVTLKNGRMLTSTSSPNVSFPSAARSGIKIQLDVPISVVAGGTTKFLVDFDVSKSFEQRGNSITQNGLLFKPTIKGTVKTS